MASSLFNRLQALHNKPRRYGPFTRGQWLFLLLWVITAAATFVWQKANAHPYTNTTPVKEITKDPQSVLEQMVTGYWQIADLQLDGNGPAAADATTQAQFMELFNKARNGTFFHFEKGGKLSFNIAGQIQEGQWQAAADGKSLTCRIFNLSGVLTVNETPALQAARNNNTPPQVLTLSFRAPENHIIAHFTLRKADPNSAAPANVPNAGNTK